MAPVARNRSTPGSWPSTVSEPDERGVVLVHDGARPLVTPALVSTVAAETARHGAAIPILPIAETLKRIDGDVVGETVERTGPGRGPDAPGRAAGSAACGLSPLPG